MHFYTICEIIFLVGGPWKSNVVFEKSLKNGCIFFVWTLYNASYLRKGLEWKEYVIT